MGLSLQEKEDRIKTVLGKKISLFQIDLQGKIGNMETILDGYHILGDMIIVEFKGEEDTRGIVSGDLVKVLDEATGNYVDLW